jgi:hypothetical protein
MLEHATTGSSTDLGRMLDSDKLIVTLSNYSKNQFFDSIRLHIPRAIRVVYDIRNMRPYRSSSGIGERIPWLFETRQ